MPLLLALDTSSATVSVALLEAGPDGVTVLAERASDPAAGTGRHGELLTPSIRDVLAGAGREPRELTAIAAGTGPGPFTGLRVGLVTARVLGLALGVPVHGVCSLDALAAAVDLPAGTEFVVATDARRREVYWARYAAGPLPVRLSGPEVGPPSSVRRMPGVPVAGRGALLHPAELGEPLGPLDPPAAQVGRLAAAGAALPPEPLYLRRPDAREPGSRKRVLT